jgi:hypothetical protein
MKLIIVLCISLSLLACNFKRVEKSSFVGKWQYAEKSDYKGVILKLNLNNDTLIGIIDSIPAENKLLQKYVPLGKEWLNDVKRKSNFLFEIKEAKPQIDELKYAGLAKSTIYKMVLVNDSTIALAENGDPYKSKNILKKLN